VPFPASPVTPSPQLSTRIGKYQLIATIGRGGMAHVHLARLAGPLGFNKLFVIKVLREDLADGHEDCVTMFLDEARLAARLSHPNIVQTFDVGEAEGRYFIAMEYLEGQCLRTVERRLGAHMPLAHHVRVLSELGKALHHAHELRDYGGEPLHVVHRDVSPQNVFLTYDGRVKLLDFGIAKAENAVHLTRVGIIKGKAEYIAPEQVRGEHVDRRADVFALGVMLYEALAGTRFAGGAKVAEITKLHDRVMGREAPLREVCPEVAEELARVCDRAIALEPGHRQATALEFAQELDGWLARHPPVPTAEGLAELLDRPFRAERERVRSLIDQQMREDAGQLAMLELRESTRSLNGRKSLTPTGERLAARTPTGEGLAAGTPTGERGAALLSAPPAQSGLEPAQSLARRARRPSKLVLSAAALLFVMLLGGTYLTVRPGPQSAQARAGEPAPARVVEAPLPPPTAPAPRVHAESAPLQQEPAPAAQRKPASKRRGVRPERAERAEPPTPARPAEPSPAARVEEAPREVEPGADFRDIAPTRRRTGELELEEDAYE
jgi:serine/threonine protein kinase